MIYKLMHRLFGWDYVGWSNTADYGVARVFNDGTGGAFYFRYKGTKLIDKIRAVNQVVWLTCLPEKYMNIKDTDVRK